MREAGALECLLPGPLLIMRVILLKAINLALRSTVMLDLTYNMCVVFAGASLIEFKHSKRC